jgi:aromatic ring-opening dioxygenase LigB subunit
MMAVRGDFDYLMPTAISEEIEEMTEEEWLYLIEILQTETLYEKIVLDFGASVPSVFLLTACEHLLVVSEGSLWEEKLVQQFERILERLTGDSAAFNIQKVCVDRMNRWDI